MGVAEDIRAKALELGFEGIGTATLEDLAGFAGRVDERERKVPLGEGGYAFMRSLARPELSFPEARSVVAVVQDLGRYRVPDGAAGLVGRAYLFDPRRNPLSPESRMISELSGFMARLGVKALQGDDLEIVPMRWAAWKAGLGIMRRNNFLYTATGSWKSVAAWVTDRELDMPKGPPLPPCPEDCGRCAAACPTGSLSGPWVMDMSTCVSYLTAHTGMGDDEALCRGCGGWLYGCDACQDACPVNLRRVEGAEEFPGLNETVPYMDPGRILAMGLPEIRERLGGKFFYVGPGKLFMWKVLALNVIANTGRADLEAPVRKALDDPWPEVRRKAGWALGRLGLGG